MSTTRPVQRVTTLGGLEGDSEVLRGRGAGNQWVYIKSLSRKVQLEGDVSARVRDRLRRPRLFRDLRSRTASLNLKDSC